jgi:hypothetical protein
MSATLTESTLPGMAVTLTIRHGAKVTRERHRDLAEALGAIEERGLELEHNAHSQPRGGTLMRRLDPVQQVVARLELSGRGLRAGVDVRGDGSSEAFTGRMRRRLVEQRRHETPYQALRRTLDGR